MSIRAPLFLNQSMLGATFAQIFREFLKVLGDFARILWDFAQIFTNQNFWGCGCTPCTPAYLHQ